MRDLDEHKEVRGLYLGWRQGRNERVELKGNLPREDGTLEQRVPLHKEKRDDLEEMGGDMLKPPV